MNGHGPLTFEDARTWMEETGLCLFLPRRQYSSSVAPSFVEAVAGERNSTPDPNQIALAEDLLVRLERDDVAVRLNLLGQPGEQPDFVVAAWVLPYVYALRGDRDWRRSPQLTGSRQVSQLAVQAYKLLEVAESTIPQLKHTLGREVTETAVLRAITELWQQLRIIPVISAPGEAAKWQLLRLRFQKAIAEGASTSQVTAISVLASIYLQAVIAASMEEVELFLAPLTARSKIREVLRGLVATRQVHTISLGHSPHFYVAGTLPEFGIPTTIYASAALQASPYFLHSMEHQEEMREAAQTRQLAAPAPAAQPTPVSHVAPEEPTEIETVSASAEPIEPAKRKPAPSIKTPAPRTHFSRPPAHSRDRKPGQSSSNGRVARRSSTDSRSAAPSNGSRTANAPRSSSSARPASGSRPASAGRWKPAPTNGGKRTGTHSSATSARAAHSNGTGALRTGSTAAGRSAKPSPSARSARPAAKPAGKSGAAAVSRKPALTSGSKASNGKAYEYSARPGHGSKKRG